MYIPPLRGSLYRIPVSSYFQYTNHGQSLQWWGKQAEGFDRLLHLFAFNCILETPTVQMEDPVMADIHNAGAVYINFEEGVKRVVNNTKLYVKLLGKFKTDTNLDELSAFLISGEYEKAQIAAHTIKGLAANLSLTELFEKIRDLESQIKEKSVKPGALETVEGVFAETLTQID
jgi:HPt (histidine-containing phosphotransfer) domain-containing protein